MLYDYTKLVLFGCLVDIYCLSGLSGSLEKR